MAHRFLPDEEANDLRLFANDVIHQLATHGKRSQLEMLRIQIERTLDEMREKEVRRTEAAVTGKNSGGSRTIRRTNEERGWMEKGTKTT